MNVQKVHFTAEKNITKKLWKKNQNKTLKSKGEREFFFFFLARAPLLTFDRARHHQCEPKMKISEREGKKERKIKREKRVREREKNRDL